jgi:hypothetical protein
MIMAVPFIMHYDFFHYNDLNVSHFEIIKRRIYQDDDLERDIISFLEDKPLREFMNNLDIIHQQYDKTSNISPDINVKVALFKTIIDIFKTHLTLDYFIPKLIPSNNLESK